MPAQPPMSCIRNYQADVTASEVASYSFETQMPSALVG